MNAKRELQLRSFHHDSTFAPAQFSGNLANWHLPRQALELGDIFFTPPPM
jgi:hypothetical protein